MGAAANHRGDRVIARYADERMPEAVIRADRQELRDENSRLRARVAELERELARARRCLAAERHGRDQLRQRMTAEESSSAFAISTLCCAAFRGEVSR